MGLYIEWIAENGLIPGSQGHFRVLFMEDGEIYHFPRTGKSSYGFITTNSLGLKEPLDIIKEITLNPKKYSGEPHGQAHAQTKEGH